MTVKEHTSGFVHTYWYAVSCIHRFRPKVLILNRHRIVLMLRRMRDDLVVNRRLSNTTFSHHHRRNQGSVDANEVRKCNYL